MREYLQSFNEVKKKKTETDRHTCNESKSRTETEADWLESGCGEVDSRGLSDCEKVYVDESNARNSILTEGI